MGPPGESALVKSPIVLSALSFSSLRSWYLAALVLMYRSFVSSDRALSMTSAALERLPTCFHILAFVMWKSTLSGIRSIALSMYSMALVRSRLRW